MSCDREEVWLIPLASAGLIVFPEFKHHMCPWSRSAGNQQRRHRQQSLHLSHKSKAILCQKNRKLNFCRLPQFQEGDRQPVQVPVENCGEPESSSLSNALRAIDSGLRKIRSRQ